MNTINIANNGKDIKFTNYWETLNAKKGLFYLSWNANAARLLVPNKQLSSIEEMKTGKYVIISKGIYKNRNAIELLFEDETARPFSIHLEDVQCDRLILESDQGGGIIFAIWTEEGKQFELPAKYRVVGELPDLSPWSEH